MSFPLNARAFFRLCLNIGRLNASFQIVDVIVNILSLLDEISLGICVYFTYHYEYLILSAVLSILKEQHFTRSTPRLYETLAGGQF